MSNYNELVLFLRTFGEVIEYWQTLKLLASTITIWIHCNFGIKMLQTKHILTFSLSFDL